MADLDIEEVNRVRQSLGMAPLPSSSSSNGLKFKPPPPSGDEPDDAVPDSEAAGDLAYLDQRQAEAGDNWQKLQNEADAKKRRETKREQLKKQRDAAQRFAKLEGKGLGDDGDDDQDTRAWLLSQNKRKKKIEKERARMLQKELEDRENQAQYTEKDLSGARVGHELGDFDEGEQILTLKDANVEDEDEEDELENITLRERAQLKERLELKKKRTVYNPMDDEEDPTQRSVLAQYDEEIEGKKKGKVFTLGSTATAQDAIGKDSSVDPSRQRFSLDFTVEEKLPISDYMDISEIKVKKPKKKKDKSKSKRRPVDDDDSFFPAAENDAPAEPVEVDMQTASAAKRPREESTYFDDDDLQSNLAAQRRAALKKRKLSRPEDLARQLREEASATPMEEDHDEGGLVIDETSEFVANLQKPEAPKETSSQARQFEQDIIPKTSPEAEHDVHMHNEDSEDEAEAEITPQPEATESIPANGLDEEKGMDQGIGAALSLLRDRGLIHTADSSDLNAQYRDRQRFLAAKQQREEEAERKARLQRERDRASGKLNGMSMKEREQFAQGENKMRDQQDSRQIAEIFNREYKPNVNLTYTDEFGRSMNQKEAFKHLSHQFHGKGSGKQKTEKMLKKIEDEKRMEAKSALDGNQGSGMGNAANVTQKKNRQAGVRLQ